MSTIVQEGSEQNLTICGTPLYSSPQLLAKKGYSYRVDIWALGILTYELLMARTPFHSKKLAELLARINRGDYAIASKDAVSIECAMFLVDCLQADEVRRTSYERIKDHPFLYIGERISFDPITDTQLDRVVTLNPMDKRHWQRSFARITKDLNIQSMDLIDYSLFKDHEAMQNLFIFNTQNLGEKCIETLRLMYQEIINQEVQLHHSENDSEEMEFSNKA